MTDRRDSRADRSTQRSDRMDSNGLLCAKLGVRHESGLKRANMPASNNRSVSDARCPAAGRGEALDSLTHLVLLPPVLTAGSLQPKSEIENVPGALGRICAPRQGGSEQLLSELMK